VHVTVNLSHPSHNPFFSFAIRVALYSRHCPCSSSRTNNSSSSNQFFFVHFLTPKELSKYKLKKKNNQNKNGFKNKMTAA